MDADLRGGSGAGSGANDPPEVEATSPLWSRMPPAHSIGRRAGRRRPPSAEFGSPGRRRSTDRNDGRGAAAGRGAGRSRSRSRGVRPAGGRAGGAPARGGPGAPGPRRPRRPRRGRRRGRPRRGPPPRGQGRPGGRQGAGPSPPRSPPHASVCSPVPTPRPTPQPKPLPGFPPRRERTPELATAGQSAVGRSRGASNADDRTPGRPRPIHLRGSARPRLDAAAEEEHGPRTTD